MAKVELMFDPIAHLHGGVVGEYKKGQYIYWRGKASESMYWIAQGLVEVIKDEKTLDDIYGAKQFFGRLPLLDPPQLQETARALETTTVLSWPASEVQRLVLAEPSLWFFLTIMLAKRSEERIERIHEQLWNCASRRLALALLRFGWRLGSVDKELGEICMLGITHDRLARYIGTSREIVAKHMSNFRRLGLIEYNRSHTIVRYGQIEKWLMVVSNC